MSLWWRAKKTKTSNKEPVHIKEKVPKQEGTGDIDDVLAESEAAAAAEAEAERQAYREAIEEERQAKRQEKRKSLKSFLNFNLGDHCGC